MWLLWTLSIAFIGQLLFIYGFLPIKIAGIKVLEDRPLPTSINGLRVNPSLLYKPAINKLILLVIDALRDDFITGSDASHHMPYLSSLFHGGEGVHFTSLVEPPTVTLPRIKAITMGTIPNYADVILNVLEKGLNNSQEDSFIKRASYRQLNIIFYGDDTWLRIFPNSFLRFEGTTSFYVSDFNEVDANVTRHLDHELRQDDWDIMILHYLGLDHIGHIHGPYSKLIPSKLQEMDDVIKKIHLGLKKMDHSSLLVICGDHGMKDTGGHGGATYSETHVPLIFISPSSLHLKSHCKDPSIRGKTVNQRDLASTLSILLGLQPPSMNLGSALPCILRTFIPKTDAYLYALHVNAWQVTSILDSAHDSSKDESNLFEEASKLHSKWIKKESNWMKSKNSIGSQDYIMRNIADKYTVSISQTTSMLAESLVYFDYYMMFIGVVFTWQGFTLSLLRKEAFTFKGGLMKTFLLFITIMMFHFSICSFGSSFISNSSMCSQLPVKVLSVIFLILLLSFNTYKIFQGFRSFKISHLKVKLKVGNSLVNNMLMVGTILHAVSLFSSSFIEEEHQTWQFLSISLIILLCVKVCHNVNQKFATEESSKSCIHSSAPVPLICSHKLEDQNVHFMPLNKDKICIYQRKEWLYFIAVLFICRILRDYNHTGDKWGSTPDIGDWMSELENIGIRSIVMALSLFGINFHLIINSATNLPSYNGVLIVFVTSCIYAYRAAIGDVSALNIYPRSRGTTEFHLILILTILIFASGCYEALKMFTEGKEINSHLLHDRKPNRLTERASLAAFVILTNELCKFWIILCTSLNQPSDVPVMLAFLFCCHTLAYFIMNTGRFDVYTISKTFIWLGMTFYFFKGNSNSLASVDLKAAYTGQETYNSFIVGILLFCHTFSMPILAVLLLFHYLARATFQVHNFDVRCTQKIMDAAAKSVITARLFPVVFYLPLIIVLRHHLFIWTVFTPKLIYEAMFTLASFCSLSILIILHKFLNQMAKIQRAWYISGMNV